MKLPSIALLFAAACSSSAPASKAPADEPAGRVEKLQVAGLESFALADGKFLIPNNGKVLAVGQPTKETGDLLAAAGLSRDEIRLDIQCLLVKAGDRVLLFDTGTGEAGLPMAGHLGKSLELAGVAPAAVTDIFISHHHDDHVGGLATKAGALVFPNAAIHLSAPEWAAFQGDTDEGAKHTVAAIASKVVPFEPGAQVVPGVKAVATPGHTPGHSSYEIGEGAEKLLYLGDVAHHSVISVQRPAWPIQFDHDGAAAEPMRRQTLAKLAADHERVFAVHFPFPGVGHVVAEGTGQAWKAEH